MVSDSQAMLLALDEARAAAVHGDVPVGAVILRDGEVLVAAHNERELTGDPSAHAEIVALRRAAQSVGSWRLDGCALIVTLEPCAMCAGALVNARLDRVVFGAFDPKAGAVGSLYNLCSDPRLNHELAVTGGVLEDACGEELKAFFAKLRPSSLAGDRDEDRQ